MPSTVNGIGTHYYGTSNVKNREGVCRHCNSQTTLMSYDTRLYVVVFFIPVWPLGRKRIVDQCRRCTWHHAIDARQWEVSSQLNATDAAASFANDPSTETALRSHGQFLGYLQYEEAKAIREQVLARYPEDGVLRADLAGHLQAVSQHAEALALYNEALRLRPDLPAARAGKAQYLIAQGELDQASDLLDHLKQPGSAQIYDITPLEMLFENLSTARRHDDALALAEHLLRELPHLKNDFWFRKTVEKSEKVIGRADSLLPPANRSWWNLFFGKSRDYSPGTRNFARFAAVVAIVLVGLAIHNESIRRQRTLHVVNHTGVPARIQVGEADPITVDRRGQLTLPEGKHEIAISGPVESKETLTLASGYFDRWFHRPIWLLNVNAEAPIVETRLIYSARMAPSTNSMRLGETFLSYPDVDYAFDEIPPDSIQIKGNNDVIKKQLRILELPAEFVIPAVAKDNPDGAMKLAERKLTRLPEEKLLGVYSTIAGTLKLEDRAAQFLESQLDRRPINVEWHRMYQHLRDDDAHQAEIFQRYEKLTQENPKSAEAWYLFSRQDLDIPRRDRSLEKSLECDPKLPRALFSRAWRSMSRGEWDQATKDCDAALAADPNDDAVRIYRIYCLASQQKFAEIEADCNQWKSEDNASAVALTKLWAQFRQDKPVDVAASARGVLGELPPEMATQAEQYRINLEMQGYYAVGNWQAMRLLFQNPAQKFTPRDKVIFLLSEMTPDELKTEFEKPSPETSAMDALAVSLAFHLAGDAPRRDAWREQAIEKLAAGHRAERHAAAALSGKTAPSITEFRESWVSAHERFLVAAALAAKFPESRSEYVAEAKQWQVFPFRHYWVVDRAIRALEK